MKLSLKRFGCKLLASALAFSMVFGNVSASAAEAEDGFVVTRVSDSAMLKQLLAEKDIGQKSIIAYEEDDPVLVIVEVEGKSLLNYTSEAKKAGSYESFFESDIASSIQQNLEKMHNQIAAKIIAMESDAELVYDYYSVMNGFAVRVKYGNLKKIQALSGVKTAYIAGVYEKVEPQIFSGSEMINSVSVLDSGYDGEGTLIGIIDTGLDVDHKAFQTAPVNAKYKKAILTGSNSGTALPRPWMALAYPAF